MVSSDLPIPSDKGKGDIDQVTILVGDEEEEQASPANPQFFLYFYFLFIMAMFFFSFSSAIPGALRSRKQSPFKPPSEVYFLMTIGTISVTLLASALLIFTSYYLKNYMRNIHYTILKSVGMLSGFPVIFSTGCVVFVTSSKLNWRYSFMGVFFVIILVLYYFAWKYTLDYHQNYKEVPLDWSVILVCLFSGFVPLSVKLLTIIPKKLLWVDFFIIFAQVSTLVPLRCDPLKRDKL